VVTGQHAFCGAHYAVHTDASLVFVQLVMQLTGDQASPTQQMPCPTLLWNFASVSTLYCPPCLVKFHRPHTVRHWLVHGQLQSTAHSARFWHRWCA